MTAARHPVRCTPLLVVCARAEHAAVVVVDLMGSVRRAAASSWRPVTREDHVRGVGWGQPWVVAPGTWETTARGDGARRAERMLRARCGPSWSMPDAAAHLAGYGHRMPVTAGDRCNAGRVTGDAPGDGPGGRTFPPRSTG